MTFLSNTNALIAAQIRTPLKQLQISVSWEGGKEKSDPREAEMVLWPQQGFWMCPFTGLEVEVMGQPNGELFQRLKDRPPIPKGMSVVYWNARGILRPSFKTNFRHIMTYHNPDTAVLVETWVSREHTGAIVNSLPLTSWYLVEMIGFAGGILLLWNPERVTIHITGASA